MAKEIYGFITLWSGGHSAIISEPYTIIISHQKNTLLFMNIANTIAFFFFKDPRSYFNIDRRRLFYYFWAKYKRQDNKKNHNKYDPFQ